MWLGFSSHHTKEPCLELWSSQARQKVFTRCAMWVAGCVRLRPLVAAPQSRPGWWPCGLCPLVPAHLKGLLGPGD